MGFKLKAKKLAFTDPDLEGFEVYVKRASVGEVRAVAQMAADMPDDATPEQLLDLLTPFAERLARQVKTWNLEDDDDSPVPVTSDAIVAQGFGFVMILFQAWIDSMIGVSDTLGKGSTSGESMPEGQIPMAVLSESPLS